MSVSVSLKANKVSYVWSELSSVFIFTSGGLLIFLN